MRLLPLLLTVVLGAGHLAARSFEDTAFDLLKGSIGYHADTLALTTAAEELKTAYNLPDPEINTEYLKDPAPDKLSDRWEAILSWSVEWPGVYGSRKKESEAQLQLQRSLTRQKRVEQLTEIRNLLADYLLQEKRLSLLKKIWENTDSIRILADKAIQSGEITRLDLNKIDIEKANIRAAFANLMDEREQTLASLTDIYGSDCSNLLSDMETEFPKYDLPDYDEVASLVAAAPSVEVAQAETEVAERARKTALMEALPSLTAGYKYAYEDATHFNGAVLGLSIPLFSSHNRQKAAKARIAESSFLQEVEQQKTASAITLALRRIQRLQEQIGELEPLINGTDHTRLLMKAYEGGVITLLDYLTELNYFSNAELELYNLRHAELKAVISLLSELRIKR